MPSRIRAAIICGGLALLLEGCTGRLVHFPTASPGASVTVSGSLLRPEGTGPLPAMVVLHHCGGITEVITDWGIWLRSEGYVTLMVDSFAGRTHNTCATWVDPTPEEVALDAFGALAYLRSLPFVDKDRIGVIGWSYGALASLRASGDSFVSQVRPVGGGFRAAVAFYPHCSYLSPATSIPVLLLLGGADYWSQPGVCGDLAEHLQRAGTPIVLKVYPGARHAFDDRTRPSQYDAPAAADAPKQLRAFLAQYVSGVR
jgi:dienelactone hydrolase